MDIYENKPPNTPPIQGFDSPVPLEAKKKQNIFARFFEALRPVRSTPPPDLHRVHLLKNGAEELENQLKNISAELETEEDEEFSQAIKEIISSLLRDVEKIRRDTQKEQGEQLALEGFPLWTMKAKHWIDLLEVDRDKGRIEKQIARHIIEKVHDKIEKDILYLKNYLEKFVESNGLSEKEAQQRVEKLGQHIDRLKKLQLPPEESSLDSVHLWRAQVNKKREIYFSKALDAIDGRTGTA